MLQAILVWVGGVAAFGLLVVMALGPVIVEVDSWWNERRRRSGQNTAMSTMTKMAATTSGTTGTLVEARLGERR